MSKRMWFAMVVGICAVALVPGGFAHEPILGYRRGVLLSPWCDNHGSQFLDPFTVSIVVKPRMVRVAVPT